MGARGVMQMPVIGPAQKTMVQTQPRTVQPTEGTSMPTAWLAGRRAVCVVAVIVTYCHQALLSEKA